VIYAWAATRLLFIQMGKENAVDVTVEAKEAEEAIGEGMPMSTWNQNLLDMPRILKSEGEGE